jgi:hypothetical protein
MKKQNTINKLAFGKATVTELDNNQALEIVGGTEDMPVPTIIQNLTKISIIRFH